MGRSRTAGLAGAVALGAMSILAGVGAPSAAAQPCPDVEVVFARGTSEPTGVGGVGRAFVDALRAQAGSKTVGVYAVNYPAANNFRDRPAFARTVTDGVRDETERLRSMSVRCPQTRLVLGGYSQGAVVTEFATSDRVPGGVPATVAPKPLPPDVADHVAAVVLFGAPEGQFLVKYGVPAVSVGPRYTHKTVELCAAGDSVCEGVPKGGPNPAHSLYPVNGMVNAGARYAAGRL